MQPKALYQAMLSNKLKKSARKALEGFALEQSEQGVSFKSVQTKKDWQDLRAFRLRCYQQSIGYMLDTLDQDGSDPLDNHAYNYAGYLKGNMVASIRLRPHPFETNQFLTDKQLAAFLGNHWQQHYLEWTRLLVDPMISGHGLMSKIIIYAGLQTLLHTNYYHYFGYTTPLVRRLLKKYQINQAGAAFTIPQRGTHKYLLLKGDFRQDFYKLFTEKETQIVDLKPCLSI